MNNIQEVSLENIMGDRFGRYSKYIIQERALPDIRDGLKPVQRRILFAMNEDGNTYDKPFRKSAKSVGNVMGNYHPHGDSSIYEAMVRMSQDWKLRETLIEMHGNNGSMDGDPPAAMRYTEARLSKLSFEMMKDIEKNTVDMVLNFDDTEYEPTVLPARFPNLLVNGATGISAGYATEIPTHNLKEVIDAVVYLIENPKANLSEIMQFIKGPDFPTGGIVQGISGIKQAYQTGKGRIVLRAKTSIEKLGNKSKILITEIPYEVNKANLVKKIDEIRILKKIDGISEIRDESDREGLRIVVELKKDVNAKGILNYLLKNTDLQIAYNFNMVAINNKRPEQVGILEILKAYIKHQRDVVKRRTIFDLNKAKKRAHIVEGLIYALSILDKVIKAIRNSNDKKNAVENLVSNFDFSKVQAESVVSLQLYRLTNTDITALKKEFSDLEKCILKLNKILESPKELDKTIKKELLILSKNYLSKRRTVIQKEIEQIEIKQEVLVQKEEVMLLVSHFGYVKRSSMRSFRASNSEENGLKEDDFPVFQKKVNTLEHVLMFTNKGHVIYRPVHEINESKWKETGEHLSQTVGLDKNEVILKVFSFEELNSSIRFVFATKEGLIKQTELNEFKPGRLYRSKANMFIKLKTKSDEPVLIDYVTENQKNIEVFCITYKAYGLRFSLDEVPLFGVRASGVKCINLKDDTLSSVLLVKKDDVVGLITNRGAFKEMNVSEVPQTARARRGVLVMRELKSNPHRIISAKILNDDNLEIITNKFEVIVINPKEFTISNRYSNGTFVVDTDTQGIPMEIK